MRKVRKFSVILTSDVLNLKGRLVAVLRLPATYQISRNERYQVPETSYEVDVESLLPQFGIVGEVTNEDMHKHHLSPGKDGRMYLCCFKITEQSLIPTIRLWLAHQVLAERFGLDIAEMTGEFTGDGEFFQKARSLKSEDSSLSFTDIVLRVCEAEVKIEEI